MNNSPVPTRIQNVIKNPIAREHLDSRAHVLVYISDEALDFLKSMAIDLGYMKRQSKNLRGFSDFVTSLSLAEFYDARPEEFKAMDEAMLEAYVLPEWDMDFIRMRRNLAISPKTQSNLYRVGMKFAIFNKRRSDSPEHSSSVIGCVLESIGCGFLKPVEVRKAFHEV